MVLAIVIIVAVCVALLAIWWVVTSNRFERAAVKVEEGLSGIEVALTKRFDMLTKLRDVARSFAAHEKELFSETVHLRKGMSVDELNAANRQGDALASRIHAVAEAYPDLRSSDVFRELERGIMDAEEHLQAARRLYNSNVTRFNTLARVFPSSIVAKSKGHAQKAFFEAEEGKRGDVPMG